MIAPTEQPACAKPACAKPACAKPASAWHAPFLAMLPTIRRYARIAFRDLEPDARQEMVQEVIAHCVVAYARLVQIGKADLAYATVLAMCAIRQVRNGRRVGNSENRRDVYSRHAQATGQFALQHLGTPHQQRAGWKEQLIETSVTPVPDQAAFRIDFSRWLSTLPQRDQLMARQLADSQWTGDVARRFDLSAARVSQLRRRLQASWEQFQDPNATAAA